MESQTTCGYIEHEHAADWELEIWAPELTGLLVQAALGMMALSGIKLETKPRTERNLNLNYQDAESLLVDFINELLYFLEKENLAFDKFDLKLEKDKLYAGLFGAKIAGLDKEIKAATYHNLQVIRSLTGLHARIVLDV
jgi:SHS2 domain-containing protein